MSRALADDLARLLAGYRPVDDTEARAAGAVSDLLGGPEPFSSSAYDPGHITASAFVVHPTGQAVALVLHSKLGRWLQPGGHVEPEDSSIVVAALREVREEVGARPAGEPWLCDIDVHRFPARGTTPAHLHHDVRIAFRALSESLVVGDGADDVRWWSFQDALELDESIARPIRKLAASDVTSL
jgi:8-oxo-dGTP pyrophosphatase MutT (NUDIX family)